MQRERKPRRTLDAARRCAGAALAALAVAGVGAADEAPPDVGLDELLRVPSQIRVTEERRGGATRSEWRARFEAARAARDEAQAALAASRAELEEKAGETGAWQMSAPGGGPATETGPLSYRLSQEIRHRREEVERAEKRLRELRVEANLAGVPSDWIGPEPSRAATQP